ncbi:hypothetical protein DNTS_002826 [Danionella cerebrum]|uniref:Adrenomedullin n=1 Tax=Danionella cerebrum TaxID=2873325 RepID=A0A553QF26_9TELE|nr:hypothetical protein DNTS_002826 [Danionella translucida]
MVKHQMKMIKQCAWAPFTMNSLLQKAFLWCMLSTLLLSITSAKPLNTDGLRRLSVWIQSMVKKESGKDTPPLLNGDTDSFMSQQRNVRVKRTEPAYTVKRVERAGCVLATCSVHELAHLVNTLGARNNNAPMEKIGRNGYGRRRRRSVPKSQPTLTFKKGHLKLAWVPFIHKGN